jgi:hypothetical protein
VTAHRPPNRREPKQKQRQKGDFLVNGTVWLLRVLSLGDGERRDGEVGEGAGGKEGRGERR